MYKRQLYNSLEKIKVGLDSAPKEDEIGPVFSKLAKVNRELGEKENEMENLENLLSQEKSLIVLLNAKIRSYLSQKIEGALLNTLLTLHDLT